MAYLARSAVTANVAAATSSTTVFAANPGGVTNRAVQNDSTAILYLKFGATASTTSYTVQIPPGAYFEFPRPVFDDAVTGIWSAANGSARTTEVA